MELKAIDVLEGMGERLERRIHYMELKVSIA